MGPATAEAKLIAENYLKYNEEDVEIRRLLADALWLLRKPKEAAVELNKILEKHPEDVLTYERMGMLAEDPDGGKPAASWYDDAVARNPQAALAYLARAGFHLRKREGARQSPGRSGAGAEMRSAG